jgi:hypothetical protein
VDKALFYRLTSMRAGTLEPWGVITKKKKSEEIKRVRESTVKI